MPDTHLVLTSLERDVERGVLTRADASAVVAHRMTRMLGCARASLWTIEGGRITVVGAYDARYGRTLSERAIVEDSQLCRKLAGLLSGEILTSADVATDGRFSHINRHVAAAGRVVSMMLAPISANAQLIGALCAEQSGQPREWSAADVTKLKRLAAAVALHASRHRRMEADGLASTATSLPPPADPAGRVRTQRY